VTVLEEDHWRIDVTDGGDVLIVAPSGELDLATSAELTNAFADTNGHKTLVCDITGLTFIDSTGIRALLELQRKEPDRFALSGKSTCVEKLLELTGTLAAFRRASQTTPPEG
jgi:anti-anti-sigma factor